MNTEGLEPSGLAQERVSFSEDGIVCLLLSLLSLFRLRHFPTLKLSAAVTMAAEVSQSQPAAESLYFPTKNGFQSKVSSVEEPEIAEKPALSTSIEPPQTNGVESETYDIHTSEPGGPQSQAQAKLDSYMYSGSLKKFPRISRPVELLRYEYDVVVIGSGYGGGVAASRMARGKQSVCVLELGKERWRTYSRRHLKSMPKAC